MDNYQVAMFAIGGLPLVWGIFSTLRKRRKEARTCKEKEQLSNIVAAVQRKEVRHRHCAVCRCWLAGTRLCGRCGMWWHRFHDAEVAYRYRKPSGKEIIKFIRAKNELAKNVTKGKNSG